MQQIRHLLAIFATLLAGCASTPTAKLTEDRPKEQAQIRQRLDEILDAAAKKDFKRLDSYHLYGPKFTKLTTQAPARLDAEAARTREHVAIGAATDPVMRAEDLKVDVFGDVGIATFILDYSARSGTDTVRAKTLSTLIFVKDRDQWKIAHEHLSAINAH